MEQEQVSIVGGGVGGLALAVAVARSGRRAVVHEASDEERQRTAGAFLNLAPNGMRALDAIGLADRVADVGVPGDGIELRNASGRTIAWMDARGEEAELGFRNTMVRRADLHSVLLDAASGHGVEVRWSQRLAGVDDDGDGLTLRFDDGSTERAATAIGADGVRSVVRRHLLGESDPGPRYLGLVDIGGFCAEPPAGVVTGRQIMVFGRRGFFGYFAVPDNDVWWFANLPHPEATGAPIVDEMRVPGWREQLLDRFAADPPDVLGILRASDAPVGAWPSMELPDLASWHSSRICLLGDAAHAASPAAGQGASLALEDGVVLAATIAAHGAGETAFAAFERDRRARTRRAARAARRNTSSKAVGPLAARLRDAAMPVVTRLGARQAKRFARWEPPRPSRVS